MLQIKEVSFSDNPAKDVSVGERLLSLWEMLNVAILSSIPIGDTGYLDRLRPEEMEAPVMKGRDAWGRRFISLKLRVTTPRGEQIFVVTLFERHVEKHDPWVCGTTAVVPAVLRDGAYRPDPEKVLRIIMGGTLVTNDECPTFIELAR